MDPNPDYANYIAASHVEGKAAIEFRISNSTGGTVYHNNTGGPATIVTLVSQHFYPKVLHFVLNHQQTQVPRLLGTTRFRPTTLETPIPQNQIDRNCRMIYDYAGEIKESISVAELLSRRYSPFDFNVIYISPGQATYPLLQLHLTNSGAVIHYFASEDSEGCVSHNPDCKERSLITFPTSSEGECVEVVAKSVIDLKTAEKAVVLFIDSYMKPENLAWLEL